MRYSHGMAAHMTKENQSPACFECTGRSGFCTTNMARLFISDLQSAQCRVFEVQCKGHISGQGCLVTMP